MDQTYSVVADLLAKFHTAPEWIQALWLIMLPVTMLGMTWLMMHGLAGFMSGLAKRSERGLLVYGVYQDARGFWMVYRHGRKPKPLDWANPPPELLGQGNVIHGMFRKPEE